MWDHVIVKRCSLDDTISTEYFLGITGNDIFRQFIGQITEKLPILE